MSSQTCRSVTAWFWKIHKYLLLIGIAVMAVRFGRHCYLPDTTNMQSDDAADSVIPTRRESIPFTKRPKIVFWAKPYRKVMWKFTELSNGDGGCDISFQRKDVAIADAVVFVMKSCEPNDQPSSQSRRRDQVYVWYSHESPWTTLHVYRHHLTQYDNYFNWTMSYRTDSDIVAAMWPTPSMDFLMYRIGRIDEMLDKDLTEKPRLGPSEYKMQMEVLLKKKTKLVAWIVSDCSVTEGASLRMKAIKELEKTGIRVAKYGKCVKKPLPYNHTVIFQILASHKFYVAFENSIHCQDYITEKTIYNSFVSGAVPIIYGPTKKDTEKILPKGSYIHTEDFENSKSLSKYLHRLDENDFAYMEYFKWWMDPGAQSFPRFGFNYGPRYSEANLSLPYYDHNDLQEDQWDFQRFGLYHLCRRLKRGDHLTQTHVVPNLAKWWYADQQPECVMND